MFPISDSVRQKGFPIVTFAIIATNVYIFVKEVFSPQMVTLISRYALIPSFVHVSDPTTWFPFITAMFLHGGVFHILTNMWFLWIFGNNVEKYVGKLQFLSLYLFSGILGNIAQYLFMPHSSIPMIGASGA